MFTICPDSTHSFKIFQKSKGYDDIFGININASSFDIDSIQDYIDNGFIPNKRQKTDISSDHAYNCAEVYNELILAIIEFVIGWDSKSKKAFPDGGLFGVPLAFVGSTESQTSGNLHCHFLIWVQGLPRSKSDPNFNNDFADYKSSIASVNFPTKLIQNCPDVYTV
jgi:hypothetical protein